MMQSSTSSGGILQSWYIMLSVYTLRCASQSQTHGELAVTPSPFAGMPPRTSLLQKSRSLDDASARRMNSMFSCFQYDQPLVTSRI